VTDGDALLRAILADPGEDHLRLVYADWLEESGSADRAALIRVQIEMAHAALSHAASEELQASEQHLLGTIADRVWQRRREWALPPAVRNQWPDDVGGWEWRRGFPEIWHCPLALWEAHGPALVSSNPIQRVILIDREPQGSSLNPRAAKRTWFRDSEDWVQRPDERSVLPPALFDLLEPDAFDLAMFDHTRSYPSRADALAAISQACIRLAEQGTARLA
jgi:uncharacterized protein (TIGR02996 family)